MATPTAGEFFWGKDPEKADYEPTGWYTSQEEQDRLRRGIESLRELEAEGVGRDDRGRVADMIASMERQLQAAASGADIGFAQHLRAVAMGKAGPSAAEQLLQRGIRASGQQAMGMARGMRGVAPGLAAKMALRSQSGLAQEGASQAGVLRAQEIANARSQYLQSEEQRRASWALIQQIMAQQAMANAGQPGSPGVVGYGLQGLGALAAGGAFSPTPG